MKISAAKRRGFTLVEVLIVVIIIAVLAALILPKLVKQTENAYIGEAQRTLGMLRKGQVHIRAINGAYLAVSTVDVNTGVGNMGLLGFKAINNVNWNYSCDAAGLCTASRAGDNTKWITIDAATGTFNASTTYVLISTSKGARA